METDSAASNSEQTSGDLAPASVLQQALLGSDLVTDFVFEAGEAEADFDDGNDDVGSDTSDNGPLPPGIVIIGTQLSLSSGKAFTNYIILFTKLDGSQVQFIKRYSELLQFHKNLLKSKLKPIPSFPPKKWLGNMDKQFIKKRRALLDVYFSKLSKIPGLLESELLAEFVKRKEAQHDTTRLLESMRTPISDEQRRADERLFMHKQRSLMEEERSSLIKLVHESSKFRSWPTEKHAGHFKNRSQLSISGFLETEYSAIIAEETEIDFENPLFGLDLPVFMEKSLELPSAPKPSQNDRNSSKTDSEALLKKTKSVRATTSTDVDNTAPPAKSSPSQSGSTLPSPAVPRRVEIQISSPVPNEERQPLYVPSGLTERDAIVREILETERTYVEGLRQLSTLYIKPTMSRGLIKKDIAVRLFSDIEIIRNLNEQFLGDLEKEFARASKGEDYSDVMVGKVFAQRVQTFRMYVVYVNRYFVSREIIKKQVQTCPEFANFLRETKEQLKQQRARNIEIGGFLIEPVQRLPRYKLLLENLTKKTDREHPDFESLDYSVQQIEEIANYVNEKRRENESIIRVVHLQEELGVTDLVKPSRKLIKEGTLHKIKLNEKGSVPAQLYLFNDLLLCVKGNRLQTRRINMPLDDRELKIAIFELDPTERSDYVFAVQSAEYCFKFECSSESERTSWMQEIESALVVNTSYGGGSSSRDVNKSSK